MKRITSANNPVIKMLRKLHSKKGRQESGFFFFEGVKLLKEALNSHISIEKIFVSDAFLEKHILEEQIPPTLLKEVELLSLPDHLFAKVSESVAPPGILMVARQEKHSLEGILTVKSPMLIYLHDLQDPGNLGTILRSADAAGATAVLLSEKTVEPYNPKVIRGSMGSVFHLPILEGQDVGHLKSLKNKGMQLVATVVEEGAVPFYEANLTGSLCIIIGNESAGLPKEIAGLADFKITIPMMGKAQSLNAGVAASVILFEALRQRKNQPFSH